MILTQVLGAWSTSVVGAEDLDRHKCQTNLDVYT